MTRNQFLKAMGGMIMLAGMGGTAAAGSEHWDRFSCYAYVHDQCYANGANNCSNSDYNWGLDQCDIIYQGVSRRPEPPANLATRTSNNRALRSRMATTFRQQ